MSVGQGNSSDYQPKKGYKRTHSEMRPLWVIIYQYSLPLLLAVNVIIMGVCLFNSYLQENFARITYLEESMALVIKELSQTPGHLQKPEDTNVSEHSKPMKYADLDKTGRTDFALESLGGKIVKVAFDQDCPWYKKIATNPLKMSYTLNPPRQIIQPSVFPGECFSFYGKTSIVIQLMGRIFIDAVSLEHIPKELSPDKQNLSAPREFLVFGMVQPDDPSPYFYGNFFYDRDGDPVQTFNFDRHSSLSFQYINIKFISNQGQVRKTCVYRVRVHGKWDN